jgi:nitrite reductase/ring-hydroxylating ferredoxin subunit
MTPSLDAAIDTERAAISREIFVSPEYHRAELEKLYTRAWLFVGHESQIPNPGDFFASRMAEESVILCRDTRGEIHVFLNSCRHRGMKICRYEKRNTSLFVCPYHSWSYSTDGKLQGVPLYRTQHEGTLNRDEWLLVSVARLANDKGAIWATWDADAPDFPIYLDDAADHLDQVLDCRDGRPGGAEVIGMDVSARAGQRRDNEYARTQRMWVGFPQGHGLTAGIGPKDTEYTPSYEHFPQVDEYFRYCFEKRIGCMHRNRAAERSPAAIRSTIGWRWANRTRRTSAPDWSPRK